MEYAILGIFSAAFIFLFAGNILQNEINHPYPFGYFASDAFQNYGIAKGLQDSGSYKYQPFSVAGGFSDVVGTHYPILYHIVVLVSNATGLQIYDSLVLTMILFLLVTCLSAYAIIRKYNSKIAIISLPFMLILAQPKFMNAILFGQHGLITGSMFLVGFALALIYFELDIGMIIVFFSATLLGHGGEFVYAGILFVIYLAIRFFRKEFKFSDAAKVVLIGIGTFIVIIYYFVIAQYTWGRGGYGNFEIISVEKFAQSNSFPAILFNVEFNIMMFALIIIGVIIAILGLLKKLDIPIITSLFLLLLGFSNYFGFGYRAFQQRFSWPVYISIFAAIAIYFAVKLILKNVSIIYAGIIFLILSGIFVSAYNQQIVSGLMDPYHWDSFLWIQKNVEKDKPVYFFYQSMITQRSIYYASTQRKTYVIDISKFVEKIQQRKLSRYIHMDISAEGGTGLPYRKSFFKFGYHMEDPETASKLSGDFDLCNMDYLVFDKIANGNAKPLADYNLLIINELKKNPWIVEVYPNNPVVSILKNTKPGEKCIDEQQLN